MKSNELNPTVSPSEDRILHAVRRQNHWLRALTALAVFFWALAVIGGIALLAGYAIFYAPKEKQIRRDYEQYGHLRKAGGNDPEHRNQPAMSTEQALALHFTMNYVVTRGILAVVVTVIVLSCGTLITLLLVLLNRRLTLKQINYSLAQISDQLKALQPASRGPAPGQS